MQTDALLITAIIPTYRRPLLLRRAIRSVLDQTYPDLLVCVYDNASGDETASVVRALAREDPRVRYHCHPENIGMSANFAYAMEHVETPYFSMLSDDDYYYPTFYETAMAGFARHPDAMFSAAATIIAHANGKIQLGMPAEGYFAPPEGFLAWTQVTGPAVTSMVFRREVIEHVGLLDQTIFHSDVEYVWRITARYPFVTSKRPGLIFNVHAQQGTRQTAMDTALQSYEALRERVRETPGVPQHVQDETAEYLRARFSQAILYAGLTATCGGEYARTQHAAVMLRTHFSQRGRARVLDLLAGICMRVPFLRWPVGALVRAAIQLGTMAYQSERRHRSDETLRAEIKEFTHNAAALSA